MISAREILIYLAIKYGGDWDLMMEAVRKKENIPFSELEGIESKISSKAITLADDDYPKSLKNTCKPPLVLFYYGDLSLAHDEKRCISFIGTREPSEYGSKISEKIVEGLAKDDYVIVSGLAKGIDTIANETSLNKGKKTVAVLGNGIDICYPSENKELYERIKKEGLLISEYPGMTPPSRTSFPSRNRIVAGLSSTIVVGEAKKKSGTMITVSYGLLMGKNICCVPYPAGEDSVCNTFIKEGAFLVENAEDVSIVASGTKRNFKV